MTTLSQNQIEEALKKLSGWEFEDDGLIKAFDFKDFDEAWAFMGKVAEAAKAADHHPEWTNVYNKVLIRLSTHDAGGVTQRDVDVAGVIEAI
ncbi:MAG: 4a-hydroxytetrahydrobiopterin dehydratase [Planctomycetota bacterium]